MSHEAVFRMYKRYFGRIMVPTKEWYPNGPSSVRIVNINGDELVFTHIDEDNWSLETKNSFVKRLREKVDKEEIKEN